MATIHFPSHRTTPRRVGSLEDVGPFLNVITWILLVTSTLAVLTRLTTKRALKRKLDVDDMFVVAALIASVGSGISLSFQTSNGLGRSIATLPKEKILAYQKSDYASKMLYVATLVFAKLSINSLLMILTASELHQSVGLGITGCIALWGVVSEFVIAFQCGSQQPWDIYPHYHQCLNFTYFWRGTGVMNVLTDLALILFQVHVIVTLQMSIGKKITILTFFGARSLDIIAAIVQMTYLDGFQSRDPTRDLWKWTIIAQIIQCITILTSCIPYLRPLLESLPSGLYGSDELRRRGTQSDLGYLCGKHSPVQFSNNTWQSGYGTKPSSNRHSTRSIRRFFPLLSSHSTTHCNSASGLPGGPRRMDGEIDVEITALSPQSKDGIRWDVESNEYRTKILKTTTMTTQWEEATTRKGDVIYAGGPVT